MGYRIQEDDVGSWISDLERRLRLLEQIVAKTPDPNWVLRSANDQLYFEYTPTGATGPIIGIQSGTIDETVTPAELTSAISTVVSTTDAPELIRDTIGAALVAGANIVITVNDLADTIEIAVTGVAGSASSYVTMANDATLSAERALTAGAGITLTDGGANSTVTLAADYEAIQDMIASFLSAGANISLTYNDVGNTLTVAVTGLTSTDISDFTEAAQDAVGGALVDGTTIDFTYNDAGNTITAEVKDGTITATKLDSSTVPELIRDTIGAALVNGSNISITVNDPGDTITIDVTGVAPSSSSFVTMANDGSLSAERALTAGSGISITDGGANSTVTLAVDNEVIQDMISTFLVAGSNITLTYNDAGNTLTVAVSGLTSAQISDFTEAAQDAIGAALVDGTTIDFTYNDAGNSITAEVVAGSLTNSHISSSAAISQIKLAPLTENVQVGTTYTLALTDRRGVVIMYNVSPTTITVPTHASVAFSTGDIIWVGSALSTLTISPAGGVAVSGAGSATTLLAGQMGILIYGGSDTWTLVSFFANLSGDVSSNGATTTIGSSKVTSAMIVDGTITGTDVASNTVANSNLVNMTAKTVKMRHTNSSGSPEDATMAQFASDYENAVVAAATRNFEGPPPPAQALSASRSHYSRIIHTPGAAITAINVIVGTASGNVDAGIYPNSGSGMTQAPGTKYATSGSVSCPASAISTISVSATPVMGDWFGFAVDNGTATFRASGVTAVANNALMWFKAADFPLSSTPSGLTAGVGGPILLAA